MMRFGALLAFLLALSCAHVPPADSGPFAIVLGITQDGGYPQAGCRRDDCTAAWKDPARRRHVASLAIVDPSSGERWIVDATPDFPEELYRLDQAAPVPAAAPALTGILLTHAHIGHYTGLMHLGREALGARGVPVYVMPRMREFLQHNGPWDQLVRLGNIDLRSLSAGQEIRLNARITVVPILVPHRDEYSETVAFIIRGPRQSILWLPDIDKWERWTTPLESVLASVDVAYVDGTFYDASELPGRNLREIPHPMITETMDRLANAPANVRRKVRFVHLNQSNPALRDGAVRSAIETRGFAVASEGERQPL